MKEIIKVKINEGKIKKKIEKANETKLSSLKS